MRDIGYRINIYDTAHCWVCHIAHKDAYMNDFIICFKFLNSLKSHRVWPYPQDFLVSTLGPWKYSCISGVYYDIPTCSGKRSEEIDWNFSSTNAEATLELISWEIMLSLNPE